MSDPLSYFQPVISPTNLLIQQLEQFGESEPEHALVISLDKSGTLSWRCTTESAIIQIGILSFILSSMQNSSS